jgi:hypothetical protein
LEVPGSEIAGAQQDQRGIAGGWGLMRRRLFIRHLLAQRDAWEALINEASALHLTTMPGVCGAWSIKDILAHILGYEQFIADRIHEIEHGEAYIPSDTPQAFEAFTAKFGYPDFDSPLLDDDHANAWLVEKYKNVSLEEVVAQEMNALNAIIAGLENLSEDQLLRHKLYERISANTIEHNNEHLHHIRNWLAAQQS